MKKYFVLLVFISSVSILWGQNSKKHVTLHHNVDTLAAIRMYEDSLAKSWNKYFAPLDSLNNDTVPERFIILNPHYYRLFTPFTYYNSPVKNAFKSDWKPDYLQENSLNLDSLLPKDMKKLTTINRIRKDVDKAMLNAYIVHPELVYTTERRISRIKPFQKEVVEKLPPKIHVVELFEPEPVETNVGDVNFLVKKPNFWTTGGNGSFQITQNYISDNWYKGGESNNAMLSHLILYANYNDKEKVQFENQFEAKLGFNSVPSDTVHKYLVNTDVWRITSKLGIQAASNWYYTLSAEFNTQFCKGYKANSDNLVSAFMSPANLIFALGMDYKLNKKKINLSVILSPGAYNMRYVGNKNVDETKFGLKEGDRFMHDIGSKLETKMTWKIISSIVYDTRLYYFTNYKKVEAEWENTINFVLNRYLSTKIFVHLRYDDSVVKQDGTYLQLKELLSFGINYAW